MSFAIYHDLIIDVPKSVVFSRITEPQHLVNWWPLTCSGSPETGSEYNFFFGDDYDWFGNVIRVTRDTVFHIRMTRADSDWLPTTFGFDLEENNGKVLLKFWHKDWPENNAHFRRSSFCWALLLQGLKNYTENGTVIPFDSRG